ncbi:MAG: hypothetical protein BGO23_03445 [Solirubrobacterales bacterium 67-14]|nr:MAG: hypothetical protein BGO23_03445 [Solirubrobacterales bacterium 67-14]
MIAAIAMDTRAHWNDRDGPEFLLEREGEIERIEFALGEACLGRGHLLLISGGAGLGKSRLAELARERARERGLKVLSARGEELEHTMPWGLARQLLGEDAIPEPRHVDDDSLVSPVHTLFHQLETLASRQSLAIVVDDANWADEPSLNLISYVSRRLSRLPIALIVTHWPTVPDPDLRPLDRLIAEPATERIELSPLGSEAATLLARGSLAPDSSPDLIEACVAASGGNPFYLGELLRQIRLANGRGQPVTAEEVAGLAPPAISRRVLLRLHSASPAASMLAQAAAVMGDGATLPQAASLAELESNVATRAHSELVADEIFRPGLPLRFAHPLVASAILDAMPSFTRAESHLEAARILDRDGCESSLLAPHLLAAARVGDPWVVERLSRAAKLAAAQGSTEAAAGYLTRALEEPPPADQRAVILAELGRLESSLGRASASDHLRAAVELSRPGPDRASMLLDLGRALAVSGNLAEAARACESGLSEVKDPESELGRALRAAWWMAASADRIERAHAVGVSEPEMPSEESTPSLGQRQLMAQMAQQRGFSGSSPSEVAELAERAWGDGELLAGESSDGVTWSLVTGALLAAGELERELEVCDAVLADAQRRGSSTAFAMARYCRAWPLLKRGQIGEAAADARAAVDARAEGWQAFLPMAVACQIQVEVERGDLEAATAALALLDTYDDLERSNQLAGVLLARGRLRIAQGEFESALADLRRAGELLIEIDMDNPSLFPWRSEASHAAMMAGDRDSAWALAGAAMEATARAGVPVARARAHRAMAAVSPGEDAILLLRKGLELVPPAPQGPPRLERAHLLLALGSALRRSHRRAEAAEALREALGLAASGGADAIAESAREELRLIGVRASREPTGQQP